MFNAKALLTRLLQIVGDSDEYFVSGSLSFLPLLDNYRYPKHDVDAAIAKELFQTRKQLFRASESISFLSLSELAVASNSSLTRLIAPRTAFIHVDGPDGLLDLSAYEIGECNFRFSLGAGLTLQIPETIKERFQILNWEGISYQAGPPELAFIPKAVWYLEKEARFLEKDPAELKHLQDLTRMIEIIDWDFIRHLLARGGLYWMGFPLRKLSPFKTSEILSLRHRLCSALLISNNSYDLVVIGEGSAGLVAAGGAAQLGACVALVEKKALGGHCFIYRLCTFEDPPTFSPICSRPSASERFWICGHVY